jgi:hypothetical protein
MYARDIAMTAIITPFSLYEDRLKPHTVLVPVTAVNPDRRGRPLKEQTVVVAATPRTSAEVIAEGGSL